MPSAGPAARSSKTPKLSLESDDDGDDDARSPAKAAGEKTGKAQLQSARSAKPTSQSKGLPAVIVGGLLCVAENCRMFMSRLCSMAAFNSFCEPNIVYRKTENINVPTVLLPASWHMSPFVQTPFGTDGVQ